MVRFLALLLRCRTFLPLCLLLCCTGTLLAQTTPGPLLNVRYPKIGTSKASGLSAQFLSDGLGSGQFGYRRIDCTITSPTPATTDRTIDIELSLSSWYYYADSITVTASGVLPAGSRSTQIAIHVPQRYEWQSCWWQTMVDGRRDAALSCPADKMQYLNSQTTTRWDEIRLLELSVLSHKPQLSPGPEIIDRTDWFNRTRVKNVLSENWLDYTPYDLVLIDADQLLELSESQPEKVAALLQWLHAGGTLWINQVGDEWEKIATLDEVFNWQTPTPLEPLAPELFQPAAMEQWGYMLIDRRAVRRQDGNEYEDYSETPQQRIEQRPSNEPKVYSEDWFVQRRYGWGTVVAYQTTFEKGCQKIRFAYRDAAIAQLTEDAWPRRHGLTPGSSNYDFSNWLIPGVGLAPVTSFQVLITLFVLGIGPLNYWLLRRAKKLHLIVITVPLAALLVTGCLMAYGLLADGLSTRVRVQSITLVDQAHKQGTTWNRLSYYAAFAPSDGLSFSKNSAVYEICPDDSDTYVSNRMNAKLRLDWVGDEQRLSKGWLASRTPTQYLVVEPRKIEARLDVTLKDKPIARSTFDSPLQLVVVVGEDGQWYLAENAPAGETFALTEVDQQKILTTLRKQLLDRGPQLPPGFDSIDDSFLIDSRNYYYYSGQQVHYKDSAASFSLLSRRWADLANPTSENALDLPPRSYLLIAETALLPYAVNSNAVEDSSVHIVIGSW